MFRIVKITQFQSESTYSNTPLSCRNNRLHFHPCYLIITHCELLRLSHRQVWLRLSQHSVICVLWMKIKSNCMAKQQEILSFLLYQRMLSIFIVQWALFWRVTFKSISMPNKIASFLHWYSSAKALQHLKCTNPFFLAPKHCYNFGNALRVGQRSASVSSLFCKFL